MKLTDLFFQSAPTCFRKLTATEIADLTANVPLVGSEPVRGAAFNTDLVRRALSDTVDMGRWLVKAFTWDYSPQGDKFWREQFNNNKLSPCGREILSIWLERREAKERVATAELAEIKHKDRIADLERQLLTRQDAHNTKVRQLEQLLADVRKAAVKDPATDYINPGPVPAGVTLETLDGILRGDYGYIMYMGNWAQLTGGDVWWATQYRLRRVSSAMRAVAQAWKNELLLKGAKQATEPTPIEPGPLPLHIDIEMLRRAAIKGDPDALEEAFVWDSTKQGALFWGKAQQTTPLTLPVRNVLLTWLAEAEKADLKERIAAL